MEEGPPYAAFLFCAESTAAVLPTLRSRCVELRTGAGGEAAPAGLAQPEELLCRALGAHRRGAVTEAAVRLEKKRLTREDLAALLERGREWAAAALLAEYGHPPRDEDREIALFLAKNLTKKQIMRTIDLFEKYRRECVYNVSPGHVLGALAVELEGIL